MKKLLIILILTLPGITVLSQIKFNSSIEAGYEDRHLAIKELVDGKWKKRSGLDLTYSMFGTFDLGATYKGFSINSVTKTYFTPYSIVSYNPTLIEYSLGIYYNFKRITIGYGHMCAHSIDINYFNEFYDRFSIKLKLIK